MRREKYVVTLNRPDGVSQQDMIDYIRDAVLCERKHGHPDDPMNSCELEVHVRRSHDRAAFADPKPVQSIAKPEARKWGEVVVGGPSD